MITNCGRLLLANKDSTGGTRPRGRPKDDAPIDDNDFVRSVNRALESLGVDDLFDPETGIPSLDIATADRWELFVHVLPFALFNNMPDTMGHVLQKVWDWVQVCDILGQKGVTLEQLSVLEHKLIAADINFHQMHNELGDTTDIDGRPSLHGMHHIPNFIRNFGRQLSSTQLFEAAHRVLTKQPFQFESNHEKDQKRIARQVSCKFLFVRSLRMGYLTCCRC